MGVVFAGLEDSDLLVVSRGFVDDVVEVIGVFDFVKDDLAFGRDGCVSLGHGWKLEMGDVKRGRRGNERKEGKRSVTWADPGKQRTRSHSGLTLTFAGKLSR